MKFTFLDGTAANGYVLGTVFYCAGADGKKQKFFLHKDERGENKQAAQDLVYVKSVVFDSAAKPAATAPEKTPTPAETPAQP